MACRALSTLPSRHRCRSPRAAPAVGAQQAPSLRTRCCRVDHQKSAGCRSAFGFTGCSSSDPGWRLLIAEHAPDRHTGEGKPPHDAPKRRGRAQLGREAAGTPKRHRVPDPLNPRPPVITGCGCVAVFGACTWPPEAPEHQLLTVPASPRRSSGRAPAAARAAARRSLLARNTGIQQQPVRPRTNASSRCVASRRRGRPVGRPADDRRPQQCPAAQCQSRGSPAGFAMPQAATARRCSG